jgi:hypothetical protein
MDTLLTQGMSKPNRDEYTAAATAVTEYAQSGAASNRFARDAGNVAMFLIALALADRMNLAPASLADRREWVRSGGSAVTARDGDWDRLVPGGSRPDQRCQRRLMSALALRTGRAIRLDWVNVDGVFWLVRTA